ncbi:ABC-type multidrug transport system ATPase subunit [Streptomyces sp. SLBN-118]|uniref:ATP-binding cassette domain-containing protein n=1 Tax=Streptomyces sp. SLBN-118 TaxID=2768454 RepID=UPI0011502BD5|nr:ATP-binding cassette domain-containing protein [Streptomyces sp. SLBN-118]TQK51409.1 ABC-type multidrug transport system ATPase subunit [Streptomyces sp. SLBN-118]
MLQAIGLTSAHRRNQQPAVDDVTFEARPGLVTALLGASGSGKTTALRLMLQLEAGRGITYFRGNALHRIAHPAREVGVLLGDVPGHPARTVRGQLRMLCAATGVPASRADEMLEVVGLAGLGGERLGMLSLGMDRRLGLASALLGDPQTLILDEPAKGLSPRENSWLYGLLRAHAAHGGTVLCTTSDPKEAARLADRVVTLDAGRLVADQDAAAFSRTRLRPRVAVRSPHAARLAALVAREARAAQRSVEVVTESGSLLSVYGSTCAEVGDTAFRHGVLVHGLSDEVGDAGPEPEPAPVPGPAPQPSPSTPNQEPPAPAEQAPRPSVPPQPSCLPRPVRSPLWPLRYELRRLLGVRTALFVLAAVLVSSAALCVLLGRTGETPLPALLAAWPEFLPLPPAAFGAGLLGARSFGEEFRYPALAAARGTVPRRFGLLLAKLTVTAAAALLIALLVAVADFQALRLVYGSDAPPMPQNWSALMASWSGLAVGCAWAGVLGAAVFRVTAAGVAAVLAVPVLIVPLVQKALSAPSVRSITGLPGRLRELTWVRLPQQSDNWLMAGLHLLVQPVGAALALSLSALICAYLFTGLRRSARW